MSSQHSFCPKCGAALENETNFCANCGSELSGTGRPVGSMKGAGQRFKGIRSRVKVFKDKASTIKDTASGVVSQDKASEAVRRMIDLLIRVARDVRKEIPPDMVKAVDLEAEISFIAFSIGVSIDLEQIKS